MGQAINIILISDSVQSAKPKLHQIYKQKKIGRHLHKYTQRGYYFLGFCYTQNCQLWKTAFTLRPGDKGAGVQADQWAPTQSPLAAGEPEWLALRLPQKAKSCDKLLELWDSYTLQQASRNTKVSSPKCAFQSTSGALHYQTTTEGQVAKKNWHLQSSPLQHEKAKCSRVDSELRDNSLVMHNDKILNIK